MARLAYCYDSSKCMGCHGCQVACKQWNQHETVPTTFNGSYQNPPTLNKDTRMIMRYYENIQGENIPQLNFLKFQCFHCEDAACVKVCPSGALSKTSTGITAVDKDKCVACGYCHNACPFNIPMIGKHVTKCDMCLSRLENGSENDKTSTPACVKTCSAGALEFGDRDKLLANAKKRVEWLKGRGYSEANVYGDKILGGLGVITILKYSPEKYGLPVDPKVSPEIIAWKDFFNPLGILMLGGAMGVSLLHRLFHKPMEEQHDSTESSDKGKGIDA